MRIDSYTLMWAKQYAIIFAGCAFSIIGGLKLEKMEANRMTRFRDKSSLYGRTLAPGESPSWP